MQGDSDVSRLLALSRDRSAEGRRRLVTLIGELFSDERGQISDKEKNLILEILEKTISEIEQSVRAQISVRLSAMPDVPESLISFLANDTSEVAFPILKDSGVLKDEDLIEIIKKRSQEHQIAISMRRKVSVDVSQELINTGSEKVIVSLLNNANASISQAAYEYLEAESRRVDTFQEPLLRREDLPPKIAQRMYLWVSAALREMIAQNYDLDEGIIDEVLEQTAMDLYTSEIGESEYSGKSKHLAEELVRGGQANSELLINVLSVGEVHLFVSLLSTISGVRENLILKLTLEPEGEGLAVICKGLGYDKEVYASLLGLLGRTQMESSSQFKNNVRTALVFYDSFTKEVAERVLNHWRRNQDYLSALRAVGIRDD
ncbi:DUF2336 domain-containing protein [Magnetovibrio sp.]|uniref:DUF2336 domain-containing protein n=1 Tax=Magnetovibrio sp. TaxID=2024836 RepID=UPI002F94BA24